MCEEIKLFLTTYLLFDPSYWQHPAPKAELSSHRQILERYYVKWSNRFRAVFNINFVKNQNEGKEGLPLTRQNWFVCCKGEKGCYNCDTSAWAVLKDSWFNLCTIFPHELFFTFGVAPSGTCKWSRVSAKKVFSGSLSSKKVLHKSMRGVTSH